jgi:hypothetical protein
MSTDIDINQQFRKFLDIVFPHYRGVHLEVVEGGYKLFGEFYPSLDAVDIALDRARKSIVNSLKQNKHEHQEKDNAPE